MLRSAGDALGVPDADMKAGFPWIGLDSLHCHDFGHADRWIGVGCIGIVGKERELGLGRFLESESQRAGSFAIFKREDSGIGSFLKESQCRDSFLDP